MLGRELRDRLDRGIARTRQQEGHVGRLGRLREQLVGARMEQPGETRGRDAEGARVTPAQQFGGLVALRHVDEVARHQLEAAKGLAVAPHAVLVVHAAIDEIEGDPRQLAPCHRAQVLEVDGSVYVHRFSS